MGEHDEMLGMLQLAAISNHNLRTGAAIGATIALNQTHHVHALSHAAKHNMLPIQPRGLHCAQEELGTIGVRTSIGHGQDSRASVPQLEVLVRKLLTVDGPATSSIASSEVTTLTHEVRDDTVEGASFVSHSLLSSAQGTEVLRSLGHFISPKLWKNKVIQITNTR